MEIKILQTVTNVLNKDRQVLSSNTSETYILYPAEGKQIRNIVTGRVYTSSVSIGSQTNIKNYIEEDIKY